MDSLSISDSSYEDDKSFESPIVTLPQWTEFPIDIKLRVFEILCESHGYSKAHTTPKKTGLAQYSVVCKEWQAIFEKFLYRRLVLKQTCLEEFDKIVHRQKAFVEHIWLHIEPPRYNCRKCLEFGIRPAAIDAEKEIAGKAIKTLFSILSQWRKHQLVQRGGLVLEISFSSPGEFLHAFSGDISYGPHFVDGGGDDEHQSHVHDQYHRWRNGQRTVRPTVEAIMSRILRLVNPDISGQLPPVEVISTFVLRRQTRIVLGHKVLQQIFNGLPNLEHIIYEPWRQFSWFPYYRKDTCYRDIILNSLPETLKTLTIFEDFNEDYHIVYRLNYITRVWPYQPELDIIPDPAIGAAIAYKSTGLEKLSVSFMIDANDFFRACQPDWAWHNLKFLSLTSKLLTLHKPDQSVINSMFTSAGSTALSMPKLQLMEIWNGIKRHACVFRYQVTIDSTTLGWHGTLDLDLDPDTAKVWKEVALRHTRHELSILRPRVLDREDITSHAAAIQKLQLRQVIHPVSLEQILGESRRYLYH